MLRPTKTLAEDSVPLEFTVEEAEQGTRLEHFVRRRLPGISRGSVQRLLAAQHVLVDGRAARKGLRLRREQRVLIAAGAREERPRPQPELPLDVLLELPTLIVLNKPAGMPCHPLVPGETETLANALVARYPECAAAGPAPREGGLVHRLDASTSGLLLAARTPESYGRLRGLFSAGQIVKHYLALVAGAVTQAGGVTQALRTTPGDHRRMQVAAAELAEARDAQTDYEPLERLGDYTLVECRSRTGRRHQIRVHLAHVGHPLVGDELYGGPPHPGVEGALLHASRLTIVPEGASYAAPLPPARSALLRALGSRRPD